MWDKCFSLYVRKQRVKVSIIDARQELILPLLELNPGKHSGSNETKVSDDKVTKDVDVNPANVLKIFFTAVFQTLSNAVLLRKFSF